MGTHEGEGHMTVGAKLEITNNDSTEIVTPTMLSGSEGMVPQPAPLFSNSEYNINLDRIDASAGAVSLKIPGLQETGPIDKLVLDISVKPGINLLWFGTIIIFIGNFLAARKRLKQL